MSVFMAYFELCCVLEMVRVKGWPVLDPKYLFCYHHIAFMKSSILKSKSYHSRQDPITLLWLQWACKHIAIFCIPFVLP